MKLPIALLALTLAACAQTAVSPQSPRAGQPEPTPGTAPLVPLAVGNEWEYQGEYEGGDFAERVHVVGMERRGEHEWYRVQSDFQGAEGTVTRSEWWRNDTAGFYLAREWAGQERTLHFPYAEGAAPAGANGEWTEIVTFTTAEEIAAAFGMPPPGGFQTAVCYANTGQDGLGEVYCFTPGVGLLSETSGTPKMLVRHDVQN